MPVLNSDDYQYQYQYNDKIANKDVFMNVIKQYHDEIEIDSCVLKFKPKNTNNISDEEFIKFIEKLNSTENIAKIIEIIKNFEIHGNNNGNNYDGHFCIAEELIDGETLLEYCLKFKGIGFIDSNTNSYYPQFLEEQKNICKKKLKPKFYNEYKEKICDIMTQIYNILVKLKENGIYLNIEFENIIIDSNNKAFIINPLKNKLNNVNTDWDSSISALVKTFYTCINIFDLLIDEENGFDNLQNIKESTLDGFKFDEKKKLVNKIISCKNPKRWFKSAARKSRISRNIKNNRKSKFIIPIFALAVLLIAVNRIKNFQDSNNNSDSVITSSITLSDAENQAQEIYNKLTSGDISGEEAQQLLYDLKEESNSDEIQKIIFKVNDRINFNLGEEDFNAGNYMEAIEDYRKVSNTDDMIFQNAKSKIQLCNENYQDEEIQKINDIVSSGNYKKALERTVSLAGEFSDNPEFSEKCSNLYSDIIGVWINNQKLNENYFGEDGAVIIAYTYNNYYNLDGGIGSLKQEGIQCEANKLCNMINDQRQQNDLSALNIDNTMMDIAQLCSDNYLQGEYSEVGYNIDLVERNTAEEIMQYYYTDRVHSSPFLESSVSIGIGISFNPETMKCVWVILT